MTEVKTAVGSLRLAARRLHAGLRGRIAALLRGAVVCEAGAALLFFGVLAQQPGLPGSGAQALQELAALGYRTPDGDDPVRVYPAKTEGTFDSAHAGGWRPGIIALRTNPAGAAGPEIFLRHELMHEAGYRSCSGRRPLWAEEAAAIAFSGELRLQDLAGPPSAGDLAHLRERVRIGAALDGAAYRALSRLVALSGWPSESCAVSKEIETAVAGPSPVGFSSLLISLVSGEMLDGHGDLKTRYPPGSLLKIPYAASLKEANAAAIGEELAASDTTRLLQRKNAFDLEQFRFFLGVIGDVPPAGKDGTPGAVDADARCWRCYLGERDRNAAFPVEANLRELSLMLRASILSRPERFSGLAQNGFLPGSTLYRESDSNKAVLKRLRALSKTGTASDERGNPLVGHLMVAWPQDNPVFLAVFRLIGGNGAACLRQAAALLGVWSRHYSPQYGQVRVRLMTLTPRSTWEIREECPSRERQDHGGTRIRFSTCGRFKILSTAKGSRSERYVSGLLQTVPDQDEVVLQTDPETYADAVLSSEAQDLQGEAQKALRAVIFWNGVHGSHRHPETTSLCDSTHCMVFQGRTAQGVDAPAGKTDPALLQRLKDYAQRRKLDWLPFSEGGTEGWERRISSSEVKRLTRESTVLDLRRERTRNGDILVHLLYPEGEERVPCEVFRARMNLPSCPESIRCDSAGDIWIFQGIGKGHGQGLSVDRARVLATSGRNAAAILEDAYR